MAAYKSIEQKRFEVLVIYILMFFTIWTIRAMGIFEDVYSGNALLKSIIDNSIKYIVWTLPVFILLSFYYNENPFSYLKLTDNVWKGVLWGIAVGALLVIYHIARSFIMGDGKFYLDIDIFTWIHRIILIGITEEVVFRGFILQKLTEEFEFIYANTISAVLFLLIHFPGWYADGLMTKDRMAYFLAGAVFVLVFGLLQGYVLKRTRSLWACMIIHSMNNLITTIVRI
ncbi:MAG: lysostaphin resistance A-like protein [Pseudomonadota bacterium]